MGWPLIPPSALILSTSNCMESTTYLPRNPRSPDVFVRMPTLYGVPVAGPEAALVAVVSLLPVPGVVGAVVVAGAVVGVGAAVVVVSSAPPHAARPTTTISSRARRVATDGLSLVLGSLRIVSPRMIGSGARPGLTWYSVTPPPHSIRLTEDGLVPDVPADPAIVLVSVNAEYVNVVD